MTMLQRSLVFKRALFVVAAMALIGYGWLAVQVYRAHESPESFEAWNGTYSWIVGPKAKDLTRTAETRMREGLEALNDPRLPGPERLAEYRRILETAERLLVRSLRANPAQAKALTDLAGARFDLAPPLTPEDDERMLQLIDLASTMAPRVPRVQQRLGELLLGMGLRGEAFRYFHRTVDLDPGRSRDVIELLGRYLVPLDEMLAALPRTSQTLAALGPVFAANDRQSDYLDLVETENKFDKTSIFIAYADACLRAGQPERLLQTMTSLEELDDSALEAVRLAQLSRGYQRVGDHARAISAAQRAVAARPDVHWLSERLGTAAAADRQYDYALSALNDALRKIAIHSANSLPRARLYRKIAEVEQSRGRPDRAYDAYQHALAADPDDALAKQRIAEMERGAATSR